MIRGVTLHGGVECRVRLFRDEGVVRFRRGGREIPAALGSVVGTPRCTILGAAGARVAMVEHLLAALHARGFWRGVVIEVSTDELPVLDGSAVPWLEPLEALGAPAAPPLPVGFTTPHAWSRGDSVVTLEPGPPELCAEIRFDHPAIGAQRWCGGPEAYDDVLPARTFGFLEEADALRAAGLATGASLDNAIVFDDEGPLRPLRFGDEPVRHKALDALGDFFLVGRPLAARICVTRGSHASHTAFLGELAAAGLLAEGNDGTA